MASSETQEQLVGAGKSLNGREKNSGEEKSGFFFLARLDFFPPPLTAPGSPRMSLWPRQLFGILCHLA